MAWIKEGENKWLLQEEDFAGYEYMAPKSRFDMLALVSEVALKKHHREKKEQRRALEEKDRERKEKQRREIKAQVQAQAHDQAQAQAQQQREKTREWQQFHRRSPSRAPTTSGHRSPPSAVEAYIRQLGGSDVKLVIDKHLYATDVARGQGRLSLPFTEVDASFLVPEELSTLQQRDENEKPLAIRVMLLQPNMRPTWVNLKKWDMPKEGGKKKSYSYVLTTTWNDVVKTNCLQKHDHIRLWSFRQGAELSLALVRVAETPVAGPSTSYLVSSSEVE